MHERNRVKRLARESFSLKPTTINFGLDIVVMPKMGIETVLMQSCIQLQFAWQNYNVLPKASKIAPSLQKVEMANGPVTALVAFGFYQIAISPLLGPRCRYIPTCSQYSIWKQSIGAVRGCVWLATKRICRCHRLGWIGV